VELAVVADRAMWIGTILVAIMGVALLRSFASEPLPTSHRRMRLAGGLLASVLFLSHALVAESVVAGAPPATADLPVLDWMVLHRTAALTWLFTRISACGGTIGMTVLATVAAVGLWAAHHRRAAVAIAATAAGSALLVVIAKNLYVRSRPPPDVQVVRQSSLSLPSGHALGSIVVIGMLAILAGSLLGSRGPRILLACLTTLAVALIGLSRLYLGVHWLSDVLAGWLLGGAWLALCAVIVLPVVRDTHRGAPPTPDAAKEKLP
jgi:undecaprenyl-diphosphatase